MLIVLVDDDSANNDHMARVLSNYPTRCFTDPQEALSFCTTSAFDILVADQRMPDLSGIELVQRIREVRNSFVALIVSAYTDSEDLIDAVNTNLIYKYIVKPFSSETVLQHIHRAEEYLGLMREKADLETILRQNNVRLLEENDRLRRDGKSPMDSFIGYHPSVVRLKELAKLYAASDRPVLITGETGTGKELLARAIHALSERRNKPFIVINAAALPESLIESEFFGFKRGAFTGADANKPGLFSMADGGTLFLDEIGELPHSAQAKLLRVLQFGTFYPIGGVTEVNVDVRLISASNRDLRESVSRAELRQDLFYRIAALELSIPPLRERTEDVIQIVRSIAAARFLVIPEIGSEAEERLRAYPFPGNVRELESLVEKLHLYSSAHGIRRVPGKLIDELLGRALPGSVAPSRPEPAVPGPVHPIDLHGTVDEYEKQIVQRFLRETGNNLSKTARYLGLSRQGLRNKIARYGLDVGGDT